jgi:hypothetical protein
MRFLPRRKASHNWHSIDTIHAHTIRVEMVAKAILAIEKVDNLEARREAAIRASIWLLVTKGHGPHCSAVEVNRLLPARWRFHSKEALVRATGGRPALLVRMAAGGVIPAGSLGVWTPDLWAGLWMSGALFRCYPGGAWRTAPTKNRPALALALQAPCPFRMLVRPWSSSWGDCLRLGGLWAPYLGADEAGGVGVFRGLLCGARLVRHDGRTWAGVPVREATLELAKGLGVPFVIAGKGTCRAILFSPFWGALLSPDMPHEIGEWYRGWGFNKAGMCPLLPWVFLRGAWGRKLSDRDDDFPAGVVPSLVSRVSLWQGGWKVGDVMELGLRELGVTRVDNRMREAWLRWMDWKGFKVGDFREGAKPIGLIER